MKAKRQLLTACALLCSSCGGTKPEPKENKFEFDDNSYLYLNVEKNSTMKPKQKPPYPKTKTSPLSK